MRFRVLVTLTFCLGALAVPLAAHGAARQAEPPNQDDPCSRAGRNICGTLGVGYYKRYRYGRIVSGNQPSFCIDLRYWYPSRAARYRPAPGGTLRNREGERVSLEAQRKLAYATWRYGRSDDANRQAAVMLYVHALMGDARP